MGGIHAPVEDFGAFGEGRVGHGDQLADFAFDEFAAGQRAVFAGGRRQQSRQERQQANRADDDIVVLAGGKNAAVEGDGIRQARDVAWRQAVLAGNELVIEGEGLGAQLVDVRRVGGRVGAVAVDAHGDVLQAVGV